MIDRVFTDRYLFACAVVGSTGACRACVDTRVCRWVAGGGAMTIVNVINTAAMLCLYVAGACTVAIIALRTAVPLWHFLGRVFDWLLIPRVKPLTGPEPRPIVFAPKPADRITAQCVYCANVIDAWPIGVTYVCSNCIERDR